MALTTSYEIYLQRGSQWNIDSIFDDKRMALYEAQTLLKRHPLSVVQVIEERFDAETGKASSTIVFRAQPKGETPPPPPVKKRTPRTATPATPVPVKKSSGFVRYLALSLVTLGGLGLAGLLGLAYLADYLK